MTIINNCYSHTELVKKHENVAYEKSSSEQIVKVFTNLAAQTAFHTQKYIFRVCSCGSVVEHCVSSIKGCGFNSKRTHTDKKCIAWM